MSQGCFEAEGVVGGIYCTPGISRCKAMLGA